jgi:hypothetical protein
VKERGGGGRDGQVRKMMMRRHRDHCSISVDKCQGHISSCRVSNAMHLPSKSGPQNMLKCKINRSILTTLAAVVRLGDRGYFGTGKSILFSMLCSIIAQVTWPWPKNVTMLDHSVAVLVRMNQWLYEFIIWPQEMEQLWTQCARLKPTTKSRKLQRKVAIYTCSMYQHSYTISGITIY